MSSTDAREAWLNRALALVENLNDREAYREELHNLIAHLRTTPEGYALVPVELLSGLKHQRQCDEEGVEIAVSRQAVCELLAAATKGAE